MGRSAISSILSNFSIHTHVYVRTSHKDRSPALLMACVCILVHNTTTFANGQDCGTACVPSVNNQEEQVNTVILLLLLMQPLE